MSTVSRVSRRGLSRLVTAAVAVALVGGTAGVAAAHTSGAQAAAVKKPSASAPVFPLGAVKESGEIYYYNVDGKGGFKPRQLGVHDWKSISQAAWVDRDADGREDGNYYVEDGDLKFVGNMGQTSDLIPGFGHFNDIILSPGNLAGSQEGDLLARSKSGHLTLYTVKDAGGSFSDNHVIQGNEWGQYTDLAGHGDLTGDGKTDIVAKDRDGVLWLHKGTGKADKPFEERTRIGGGWNKYTKVFSNGDTDGDGHSDLLAIDGEGALWLYKGTGDAAAPFKAPVKIGNSGWNQYRLVF
ncbi:VCBS repeat-containing protein [Streptomyces mobaraensis]|uniref:FG-GAP repeat domain-containing protein n=1 Tax=Streptomyces mobaraensis TaxID=35621 RepID=UPI003323C586